MKINKNIDNFDKINIIKFLMRIFIKLNIFSLFSIYNFILEEWKSHFEKIDFQEMIESITILEKEDYILNTQYYDILIKNMNDLMKNEILNQVMKDIIELI